MPIPMYLKHFEDISQCSEAKLKINNEILWTLKEGYTIASIGLHN
jgi:hypothetical protein